MESFDLPNNPLLEHKAKNTTPSQAQLENFVFVSSYMDTLFKRLQVLAGENLAGNPKSYHEVSAILGEEVRIEVFFTQT